MIQQNYSSYKEEDHRTWSLLFERQNRFVLEQASEEFQKGFELVSIDDKRIVNLDELNEKLNDLCRWGVVGVAGLVDNRIFFEMLSQKKFPITVNIRRPDELAFSKLPDIFHDVYGHIPMLVNDTFSNFMVEYGRIALKYVDNQSFLNSFSRLYWFTLEMGLIKENNALKPYGGAILTSSGEIENINNPNIIKHQFDLKHVINCDYDNLRFQKEYFFIDSFDQLFDSLTFIDQLLTEEVPFS